MRGIISYPSKVFDSHILSDMGIKHFQDLFRVQRESSIAKILQITQLYPGHVEEEDNEELMPEGRPTKGSGGV